MRSTKRRLTDVQEFEIMKLILDKFLWLGFIIMAFGLYQTFYFSVYFGLTWIGVGAIFLLLFTWIVTKEYEIIK